MLGDKIDQNNNAALKITNREVPIDVRERFISNKDKCRS